MNSAEIDLTAGNHGVRPAPKVRLAPRNRLTGDRIERVLYLDDGPLTIPLDETRAKDLIIALSEALEEL